MDNSNGQSASVAGSLEVNGDLFRLAQVGPAFCILRNPKPHVAGAARLVISIDGQIETTDIYLPDGISAENREVRYELREVAPHEG